MQACGLREDSLLREWLEFEFVVCSCPGAGGLYMRSDGCGQEPRARLCVYPAQRTARY